MLIPNDFDETFWWSTIKIYDGWPSSLELNSIKNKLFLMTFSLAKQVLEAKLNIASVLQEEYNILVL